MQEFLQQLVNGLSVGAIYALIAVGYTMVYGVLQLINFAHGDVFMVGALLCLVLARAFGFITPLELAGSEFKFLLVALLAIAACGLLGFLIERLAYRPLRHKPRINALITAIGVSLLLEFGGQHQAVFGPTPQAFPSGMLSFLSETGADGQARPRVLFNIGLAGHTAPVTAIDTLVFGLTILLMCVLSFIVLKTKTGLALRAVSINFDTASLMGVNINRIVSFTFVLGSMLAATAGILYAIKYPRVEPLMGLFPGIKAFIAAVFGGIGNITGAVVASLMLGVIEAMVIGYLPNGSSYKDAVAFVILIAILLVKPSGLFGRNVIEKV